MSNNFETADATDNFIIDVSKASTYCEFQALAQGTNINPTTLLTTDYLNHFNGFLMVLELLPSAPEDMAKELVAWEPTTYVEHFQSSGFRDRDLAVAAYGHVPKEIIEPFEQTVDELNEITTSLRDGVREALESGKLENSFGICVQGVPQLQILIEQAGSIVNGVVVAPLNDTQLTVDTLFE